MYKENKKPIHPIELHKYYENLTYEELHEDIACQIDEAMMKTEIVIVDINLDIDIQEEIRKATENISKDTVEAINNAIEEHETKTKEKSDKIENKKKEKEMADDKMKKCIELLESGTMHNPIPGSKLLDASGSSTLSGLMLKIKKMVNVQKKRYMGKTSYYIEKSS